MQYNSIDIESMYQQSRQLFLNYRQAEVSYTIYNGGDKIMLAFHGFGQSKEYFTYLAESIRSEYTLISFDLFFHGKSIWHAGESPLTRQYWQEIMQAFLDENDITRFSLCGFSMGGKFVLATLEAFAPNIDNILLIAPDGIKTNLWYSMATYPGWATSLFRKMVTKPEIFYKFAATLRRLKLVDQSLVRFAEYQMQHPEKRRQVFYSWVVFADLKFNMRYIADCINRYNINLRMFIGRYDKIITQNNMNVLLRHLKHYELKVLDTGHYNLINTVAGILHQENTIK